MTSFKTNTYSIKSEGKSFYWASFFLPKKKFNFPFRNVVKDEESNKKEEVKDISDDDEKANSDNISESSKE